MSNPPSPLSSSQPNPELPEENPSPTDEDDNPPQPAHPSPPHTPLTKTLETQDPVIVTTEEPERDRSLNQRDDEQEEDLQVLDQDRDVEEDHDPQSGMSTFLPPAIVTPVSDFQELNPPPLASPSISHRRFNKRKKGPSKKKLQAIEKKLQTLTENLRPIPFVPSKNLDFDKHEKLLRRLGLWDFVHIEFDQNVRVDLIAQLIVKYDQRLRGSYVNELKIGVNRPDLGRALKLPVKKEKGNASSALTSEAMDLDLEAMSEESIAFIEDFVSNWVLLHEDTWMMPSEVLNWTRVIKDGHPEKVDWAGLLWFMVEKELAQGQQLKDCYYASHLQHLIKSQKEQVFCEEPRVQVDVEVEVEPEPETEPDAEPEGEAEAEVEADMEVKEEEDAGAGKMGGSDDFQGQGLEHDKVALAEASGPNIELTLGQEIVEKEEAKEDGDMMIEKEEAKEDGDMMIEKEEAKEDGDMMDVENSKEGEPRHWVLDGKNNLGDHFLQHCSNTQDDRVVDGVEETKPEEEEDGEDVDDEEEEDPEDDGFNITPKGHPMESDGLTGNLLHGIETSQMPFTLTGQLRDQSNLELLASRTDTHSVGTSVFGNGGKRDIDHDHDISHDSLNVSNKRLRTDGSWDNKLSDFETCMEQMHQWMGKARMIYGAKEQAIEESNMQQQYLLAELQRQGQTIEHLQKTHYEEIQKRNGEIYKLERELYVMSTVLDGYRKALKETQRAFSEYRQRCQVPEEPLYKDAGPGGVVLSNMELEKQRIKQEEEDRLNRIMLEQKINEFGEAFMGKLEVHAIEVEKLDKRLTDFENEVKLLKDLSARRKASETSECAAKND